MSSSRDDRYTTSGRHRRSPDQMGVLSGSYVGSHQGRKMVLPPLTTAFPSSYCSGLQQSGHPSRNSPSQNEYFTPSYGQLNWPAGGHAVPGQQAFGYPSGHEHDIRYAAQPSFQEYPTRPSPELYSDSQTSRRLPPLSIPQHPRDEHFHGSQHFSGAYQHHSSMQYIPSQGVVRSPTASYATGYDQYSNPPLSSYSSSMMSGLDARHLQPSIHSPHEGHSHHHGVPSPVEWGASHMRSDAHGVAPYPRVPSSSSNAPVGGELSMPKKKRKRADAAQLKILTDVYNRTAFPTTEERHELAKKLDMTPRSVQIWFQNKRQAARQSRASSNSLPPLMHHPYNSTVGSPTSPIETPVAGMGSLRHHDNAMSPSGYGGQYMNRPSPVINPQPVGHGPPHHMEPSRRRSPEESVSSYKRRHGSIY